MNARPQEERKAQALSAPVREARQVGALCYRITKGGKLRLLLITSRDTGRWLIPKGWPMRGRKAHKAALMEAWEEAGVRGKAGRAPIGQFSYLKKRDDGQTILAHVDVYPVRVRKLEKRYPERGQRMRKWVSPKKAMKLASDAGLVPLIEAFAAGFDAAQAPDAEPDPIDAPRGKPSPARD